MSVSSRLVFTCLGATERTLGQACRRSSMLLGRPGGYFSSEMHFSQALVPLGGAPGLKWVCAYIPQMSCMAVISADRITSS